MSFREIILEPNIEYHVKREDVMSDTHYHTAYEIYIAESERKYLVMDQLIHLEERDVVLIKPDVIHRSMNGARVGSLVEYPVTFLEKYYTKEGLEAITECFKKTVIRVRESDFKQLLACVERLRDNPDDILTLTQLLLILKNNMSRATHAEGNPDSLAAKIVDFVTENYKTVDNLEVITGKFFISKGYLCALFKDYTGTSIKKYINYLKVHSSLELIAETNLSMEEIAARCGFSSLANFSKTFKATIGTSPLSYRKENENALGR